MYFQTSILFVGHEAAGVVVKVGSDVKNLSVGSKIAIENHFYCENCYTCEVILKSVKRCKWISTNYMIIRYIKQNIAYIYVL